ncbi:sarcosine dehydrogenase, mitochondrial [Episyrphus balteatus]|uniref:sarcosine dehydrogenase, mitochondrial n=1 Tax=Episyrphus balteatus TaxID=286459 RepID=UPI0024863158|nr:sarcosine dehydrogenase, mitochondrial [Episyrphus balteatus]
MWKLSRNILPNRFPFQNVRFNSKEVQIPSSADVIIIGGGSAGCHTLYHLAKRGVKAVLLERAKLTAGTTWHTAGLVWRLRPNDVDTQLLANSRNMLMSLEEETGLDPGWIQNGGIFIAHSDNRLDEYKRLSTLGNSMGIENYMLSPEETQKLFPLLDPAAFTGALYSPGDGVVDPAMLCSALTKSATNNGAKVIEGCPVNELLVEESSGNSKKLVGVRTPFGDIKTKTVVNATGVWGKDLVEPHGSKLPLVPMKHAYIVSESVPGARGLPNIRDHDYSTYFRIQGDAICMGGYEPNPILLDPVAKDFNFGLYDLDWSLFETHLQGAVKLCPTYGEIGVKSTVCGPESFTPDHKPLMGPDNHVNGLYHSCGFNSAGMMFGGGCGEQMAQWIINGQPDLPMFSFDLRRFTDSQNRHLQWTNEKSHESYAKNYSMVFKHDQPLAGRNFKTDPLHNEMLSCGAFMEEKQGWERPGFFLLKDRADVLPYDWYGSYGHKRHENSAYEKVLDRDLKYGSFSDHQKLIGDEALACRNNAAVFNMSYFCKLFLEGPQAKEAADWIFTANTNRDVKKTVYTCALNHRGGVESDVTISRLVSGTGEIHNPKFEGQGNYIVAGGASAFYTFKSIESELRNQKFNATVRDVTEDMGIISIQGPKSREILQKITETELSDSEIPPNSTILTQVRGINGKDTHNVRLLRVSFIGELGYELHVPKEYCSNVYKSLMKAGEGFDLKNAGYRALYSLSSEKGYHLWSFDLRPDDTPIEANLGFTCRRKGNYKGKQVIDKQRLIGVHRKMAYFTLNDQIPIWGLEGVYRNGEPIGFLRRAEYAYSLKKSLGQAYVTRKDGGVVDEKYISSGKYQIDILGKMYDAECHLRSPFDPEGRRILGIYS